MKMKILIISNLNDFIFHLYYLQKKIFRRKKTIDFHCMDINHILTLEDLKYIAQV